MSTDRPDGSVVLPGVPWQDLARRYEVALRVADELIEELLGYALPSWEWKYGNAWREEQAKVRAAIATPLAPAPSATTADTCDVHGGRALMDMSKAKPCSCGEPKCAGVNDGAYHQCGGPREACAIPGCPECGMPAPPSNAGGATGDEPREALQRVTWKTVTELGKLLRAAEERIERMEIEHADAMVMANAHREKIERDAESLAERVYDYDAIKAERDAARDAVATLNNSGAELAQRLNAAESDLAAARAEVERVTRELQNEQEASRQIDAARISDLDTARKQRDEAEAAAAAVREALERTAALVAQRYGGGLHQLYHAIGLGDLYEREGDAAVWERAYRDAFAALAPDIGKAWLRERDELRELVRLKGEALADMTETANIASREFDRAVAERDGLETALREAKHRLVSRAIGDGLSESMAASSAVAIIDRALTPPAPSNSDGEKGGGK